jgi:hypothetical protein
MDKFRMAWRGGPERNSFVEAVRLEMHQGLLADWQRVEALELHSAGMVILHEWFTRADHAIRRDEIPEFSRLLQMIEDKVNLELSWQREDEEAPLGLPLP